MNKCIYCGALPTIRDIDGLFYVQCSCIKHNPFDYIGITKRTAIAQWNSANPIPISKKELELIGSTHLVNNRHRYRYKIGDRIYRTRYLAAEALGVSPTAIYIKLKRENKDSTIIKGKKVTKFYVPKD